MQVGATILVSVMLQTSTAVWFLSWRRRRLCLFLCGQILILPSIAIVGAVAVITVLPAVIIVVKIGVFLLLRLAEVNG